MDNKDARHEHEDIDSLADENERERQETRSRNRLPTLGLNFTEAAGKVIAFVNVIMTHPTGRHSRSGSQTERCFISSSSPPRSRSRANTWKPDAEIWN